MGALLLTLAAALLSACGAEGRREPGEPEATARAGVLATTAEALPGASATVRASATPSAAPSASPTVGVFDPEGLGLVLEPVGSGFDEPLGLKDPGDGSGLVVVEKGGTLRRLGADGRPVEPPFLDLRDRVEDGASEQGLLGLAFHPRYPADGRVFVNYTDAEGDTVVASFRAAADEPGRLDPASAAVVLRVAQPAGNHNGGDLAFDPEGMLVVALGDGGGRAARGNAQDPESLLGKLLRLDVDGPGEGGYAIPPDNPYAGHASFRREIWALGLRNPWRFSFDRGTGDLFVGDVGEWDWEEVNHRAAGAGGAANFGWPIMEGEDCFAEHADCGLVETIAPIASYPHAQGCSVTGGYVYRGRAEPALWGAYLFGDYCSGRIWAAYREGGAWRQAELADTELSISSFGEDAGGELYVTDLGDGGVYRVGVE